MLLVAIGLVLSLFLVRVIVIVILIVFLGSRRLVGWGGGRLAFDEPANKTLGSVPAAKSATSCSDSSGRRGLETRASRCQWACPTCAH